MVDELQAGSHLGSSVAFLGDMNKDGFPELAVSSKHILFIVSTKSIGEASKVAGFNLAKNMWNTSITSVASIGDTDGDDRVEVAIGAAGNDGGSGAIYILSAGHSKHSLGCKINNLDHNPCTGN